MASMTIALPILPGKVEQARRWGQEKMGPRRDALADSNRRLGLTRESWHVQETAQGPLLLVAFAADDPAGALQAYAASDGPYERWEKQQLAEMTGVDINQAVTAPLPETLVEWQD